MRFAAAALLLVAGCAFADVVQPWRAIDLDRPGMLARLQHDNPAHYATIEKILADAPHQPFESVAEWIRTSFDARDVDASNVLRASYPPLRRITFTLDGQQYTKLIRLDVGAALAPAQK